MTADPILLCGKSLYHQRLERLPGLVGIIKEPLLNDEVDKVEL